MRDESECSGVLHVQATRVDRLLTRLLVTLIVLYRRWWSPRRATRCASGFLYGWGRSCSSVALDALRKRPLPEALSNIGEQFQACRLAALAVETPGGSGIPSIARDDAEEAACCELDLHVQAVRDLIIQAFMIGVVVKYLSAAAYHFGGGDDWVRWFFDLLYTTMATTLIGAAGSSLWPVVLVAAGLDFACIRAFMRRENASAYLIAGWGLASFVLFFDPILSRVTDLDIFGMAWDGGQLADDLSTAAAGELFTQVQTPLFLLWWPKKLAVVLMWAGMTGLLLVVNELSRRRRPQ